MSVAPTNVIELLDADDTEIEDKIASIFTPKYYLECPDIVDEWMPKLIKKAGDLPNGLKYGNDYALLNEVRLRVARIVLHYGALSGYESPKFKDYYLNAQDHLYVIMSVKDDMVKHKLLQMEAPDWYINLYPQENHTFWSYATHKEALCVLPSVINQFYENPDFTTVSDLRHTLDYVLKYATNNLESMSMEDAAYLSYVGILKDSELQEKTGLCNLYVESILDKLSSKFTVGALDSVLNLLDMTGQRTGFEVWCNFNKHAKELQGEVLPELYASAGGL